VLSQVATVTLLPFLVKGSELAGENRGSGNPSAM
jgi:hypothetical protein